MDVQEGERQSSAFQFSELRVLWLGVVGEHDDGPEHDEEGELVGFEEEALAKPVGQEQAEEQGDEGGGFAWEWGVGGDGAEVEDNPDTRKFLTYLLEERGARVTTADDGSRAVESVQSAARRGEVIDLILMDMQMPVMDGYTATRALRAAGVRTRVVALTAHAMADDHQRCVEAGCDAYLSKPIVEDVFFETITGFLPGTSSAVAPQVRPWLEACKREFRASLPGTRESLESAVRAKDLGAVKTLAHRLRGMAGTMGLPELGRVAGACEDALRRDPGADLSIAAAELLRCLGDFGP
jgi:CheY-like chemotaxis protein